ncbi:MAG: hypothetical protein ABL999_09800 [Pyrinomonadaceae bacterium]
MDWNAGALACNAGSSGVTTYRFYATCVTAEGRLRPEAERMQARAPAVPAGELTNRRNFVKFKSSQTSDSILRTRD